MTEEEKGRNRTFLWFDVLEVLGIVPPSFSLLWRAGGLLPPLRGPLGPLAAEFVGQIDYYEKLCGLVTQKKRLYKKVRKTNLLAIKIRNSL